MDHPAELHPLCDPAQAGANPAISEMPVLRLNGMTHGQRTPSLDEAAFLRVSSLDPVLEVTRLAYDRAGRPLEVVVNVFPANLRRLSYQWSADDGRWVPPGGVLELDEMPEHGVAREVYEETGVKVRPVRLTGVYKNMKFGVISLAFLCQVTGGQEHQTNEASQVAWLSPADAVAAMPEARAVRITDALSDEGPFVRLLGGSTCWCRPVGL